MPNIFRLRRKYCRTQRKLLYSCQTEMFERILENHFIFSEESSMKKKVALLGVAAVSMALLGGTLTACSDPLGLAGILDKSGQKIEVTVNCNCGCNGSGNGNNNNNNNNQEPEAPAPAVLTAAYGSGTFSFMSAYPGYTFKQVTTSVQNIEVYDDNTYVLTIVNKNLSGDLSFDPENNGTTETAGTNDRGQTVTVYYGAFTSSEEEGIISMTLKTPTHGYTLSSGNVTSGSAFGGAKTFADTVVSIDSGTHAFDYVQLTTGEEEVTAPATIAGVYGSGSFSFMSAYPGYTFKQVTTSVQNLVLHTDGTYELSVTNKNLSGNLSFDPENNGTTDTAGTNDRGQSLTVYKGTFTESENEGIKTVVLAIPTSGYSITSGNATSGSSFVTGEEFTLLTEETTLTIDVATGAFDYATLK